MGCTGYPEEIVDSCRVWESLVMLIHGKEDAAGQVADTGG